MQRTGRSGYASFRVVVQDSRFSPSSGRVVAKIGHYNPHTKETSIDKEKVAVYLQNGAQPSPRVTRLLIAEKIQLPTWVEQPQESKKRTTRNLEKLRKNQPKEETTVQQPVSEEVISEDITEILAVEEAIEQIAEVVETEAEIETETEEIVAEAEGESKVKSEEKPVKA